MLLSGSRGPDRGAHFGSVSSALIVAGEDVGVLVLME